MHLTVGAKVMLTVNVDAADGLVNGAKETVEAIINNGSEVTLVLVKFDHSQVGAKEIASCTLISRQRMGGFETKIHVSML